MTKKKGGENAMTSVVKAGLDTLSDVVVTGIFTRLHTEVDVLMDKLERRARQFEKRFMRRVGVSLLYAAAGVFLLLAVLFWFLEYLGWSNTVTFLAMAAILAVAALTLNRFTR